MTNYSDMDVARFIYRAAESIFDLVNELKDEDESLPRLHLSNSLHTVWSDMVHLRCDLEETLYERMKA